MAKEKWVDLNELPRNEKNKDKINWKKSVGYKCKFKYNDFEGEVEIINYDSKTQKLTIKYLNYVPFEISTSGFRNCEFNKMLTSPQLGINTIYDKAKWMIDLGVSEEDAKKYTPNSSKKITVKCPYCNKEKKTKINNIYYNNSIGCTCGDGTSYPEKFTISLLDQLNVNYIKEYSPEWIDSKKYDFYFELDNEKYIIETHGKQHYDDGFEIFGGRNLKEEQQNDQYKRELALSNGINDYIILDCRESSLDWIKSSIINSKLNKIFDLSNVDWFKCEKFALSNRVKEVCNYWKIHNEINGEELSVGYLCDIFNLARSTVRKYLKIGVKFNWCNYNPEEEREKILKLNHNRIAKKSSKKVEVFKDGKSLGVFESYIDLENKSVNLFGTKLHYSEISEVIRGIKKSYKGFTFTSP